MPSLIIIPDVEANGFNAMKTIEGPNDPRLMHLGDRAHVEIGALTGGMSSGAPSVAFCFELPDSKGVVIAETSLREFIKLAPEDVLTSDQSGELLAPLIKPLPSFDEAVMAVV